MSSAVSRDVIRNRL